MQFLLPVGFITGSRVRVLRKQEELPNSEPFAVRDRRRPQAGRNQTTHHIRASQSEFLLNDRFQMLSSARAASMLRLLPSSAAMGGSIT